MSRVFHAHSTRSPDESDWQTLSSHLNSVGKLAGQFGRPFGAEALATTAGKLHDLGKYTDAFQKRIRGDSQRVDHATWGARIACERYGALGRLMAYGIAGHHAGLANGRESGTRTSLDERLAAALPPLLDDYTSEIVLPEHALDVLPSAFKSNPKRRQFQLSVLCRMLFSTIVDADYLDTDRYYAKG
jgi:CRISPR-associated endonuclease/helicase Cas3